TSRLCSSFGEWVQKLRHLAGRDRPNDEIWRFEKFYVCLYAPDGSSMSFFDVMNAPPWKGPPNSALTLDEFIENVRDAYEERNGLERKWADRPEGSEDTPVGEDEADEDDG